MHSAQTGKSRIYTSLFTEAVNRSCVGYNNTQSMVRRVGGRSLSREKDCRRPIMRVISFSSRPPLPLSLHAPSTQPLSPG